MGIERVPTSATTAPVYVGYAFESVMFRCVPPGVTYRQFYGEPEYPTPIPNDNRLFNDALSYGEEITAESYHAGKRTEP